MIERILERREFFRWSAASLTALGLGSTMPLFLRRALAAPLASGKKLMFIFLRGGVDAVQAVIPYGDAGGGGDKPDYLGARPRLAVPPAQAHDLNGFASLNPALQTTAPGGPRVADIFHGTLDGRGRQLAILHRVGYQQQNRSHFNSQQFWENAVPGNQALEEGWLNRYITEYADAGNPLQAATINGNQLVMMKGQTLIPVLRSIDDFSLPSNVELGVFPTPANRRGSGLKGAYGQTGFDPAVSYNALTYGTGRRLLESLQFFEDNVRSVPYTPAPEAASRYAAIGDRRFAGFVQDCARLMKQVGDLQIVGCNQDGYDTHGAEDRRFPNLMRDLGLALTALYFDLEPIWDDTIIVTMSEFGRTSLENGNLGTDHGESTCMFVMGGPVRGGVYNCDASSWANGDLFSTPNGRYVAHRTDFRAVYHEIITRHLGDSANKIDSIIPDYSALEGADTQGYFSSLGFLA